MTTIEITGSVLRTPEDEIADCWEDRASGLLTRAAGLALMPYINEGTRREAAHDRALAGFEWGDPAAPPPPEPVFTLTVDGEAAVTAHEVERDETCGIFINDGQPTGRIYVSTLSQLLGS